MTQFYVIAAILSTMVVTASANDVIVEQTCQDVKVNVKPAGLFEEVCADVYQYIPKREMSSNGVEPVTYGYGFKVDNGRFEGLTFDVRWYDVESHFCEAFVNGKECNLCSLCNEDNPLAQSITVNCENVEGGGVTACEAFDIYSFPFPVDPSYWNRGNGRGGRPLPKPEPTVGNPAGETADDHPCTRLGCAGKSWEKDVHPQSLPGDNRDAGEPCGPSGCQGREQFFRTTDKPVTDEQPCTRLGCAGKSSENKKFETQESIQRDCSLSGCLGREQFFGTADETVTDKPCTRSGCAGKSSENNVNPRYAPRYNDAGEPCGRNGC